MNTAHRYRIKVDSNVAIISIKNFPIGLHVMYLYFPDTPCIFVIINDRQYTAYFFSFTFQKQDWMGTMKSYHMNGILE